MCDYSLAGIPNRLAVEGEDLVIRRFPTGSIGLASPCESASIQSFAKQTPAVCVPPDARLRLRDIPEHLRQKYSVGTTEDVTLVQLSATPCQYPMWPILMLSSRDHEHEAYGKVIDAGETAPPCSPKGAT